MGNSDSQKSANRGHFGHMSRSILIIETILLCESLSNKTKLVPFNRTIRFGLDFVYPFAAY